MGARWARTGLWCVGVRARVAMLWAASSWRCPRAAAAAVAGCGLVGGCSVGAGRAGVCLRGVLWRCLGVFALVRAGCGRGVGVLGRAWGAWGA